MCEPEAAYWQGGKVCNCPCPHVDPVAVASTPNQQGHLSVLRGRLQGQLPTWLATASLCLFSCSQFGASFWGEGGPVWPQGWASGTASAEDRGTGTRSPVETRRAVTVQNGKCMGIRVRTSRLWSWLQRRLAWDYAEFPGVSSLGFPSVKQITAPP